MSTPFVVRGKEIVAEATVGCFVVSVEVSTVEGRDDAFGGEDEDGGLRGELGGGGVGGGEEGEKKFDERNRAAVVEVQDEGRRARSGRATCQAARSGSAGSGGGHRFVGVRLEL